VVVDGDVQHTTGLDELLRHGPVVCGWRGIAGRVIVRHDDPRRVIGHRETEDLSGVHEGRAQDAAGDFVVVWQSLSQDGSGYGVFGQRYASSGAPSGLEFRVNSYTTDHQRNPAVAVDGAGTFVFEDEGRATFRPQRQGVAVKVVVACTPK